jgi:hypothetical protein
MRQLVSRIREALESFAMAVSFGAGAATFLVPPRDIDRMVCSRERVPPKLAAIYTGDWLLKPVVIAVIVSVWS